MRTAQKTRTLGKNGPTVSALGLGAMGMSDFYGPADREESVATLKAALDEGITLIDTGDFYGSGHNEILVGEAIRGCRRDEVVISVKFGALRDPQGNFTGVDLRPVAIRNFLAYSLKRLNTDYIDVYRPARMPPGTDVEEVVRTLADLVKAGNIRHIGLSEIGAKTLRRAAAVHPIVDLQIEYSLASRDIEPEILPTARELGIGITAYGVLSRGLLVEPRRHRQRLPGPKPSLPGRQSGEEPAPGGGHQNGRSAQGHHRRAGSHRVGAVAGRGHHPADRCADA